VKNTIVILLLVFIVATLSSCSKQISYTAYEELILNFEDIGFTIDARDVEEHILAGERKWLTINESDNISVFIYENSDEMEKDASYISDDGFTYDNGKVGTKIEWVSYPHFFKSENIIILYVGENSKIVRALEEHVGLQFAGYIK